MKLTSDPTVDGQNPAPPKKPWNNDSPVNTNKQRFPMVSKWCRISSNHSMKVLLIPNVANLSVYPPSDHGTIVGNGVFVEVVAVLKRNFKSKPSMLGLQHCPSQAHL